MIEKSLEKRLKDFLKKHQVYFLKIHGSAFQKSGVPDLLIFYKNHLFAVELKVNNNRLSPIQKANFVLLQKSHNELLFLVSEKNIDHFIHLFANFLNDNNLEALKNFSKDQQSLWSF